MQNRVWIIIAAGIIALGGATAMFYRSRPPAAAPVPATRDAAPATAAAPARTPVTASSPAPAGAPSPPKPVAATPTPEAPATGTLIIDSDVPDTGVFLDRVFVGTAPVTVPNVTPGPHSIRMSATSYDGYADTIDVAPGTRTISVKFKEIRLDATLAVVHKHAIGSCVGTLRATPQGLTYDTTNKGDAFTAPLTDLDTFTMDYLTKNLRVKVKGGKTYNFADPDGNVNRLYLFHQDVDKARQRLLAGR